MKSQSGLASVEFAIIAAAFFLIMLGAIEVSRLLFTWNTLDAVTQRAARIATVCPPDVGSVDVVKRVALFGSPGSSGNLLPGLNPTNLLIQYLDEDFVDNGNAINGTRYVRAQIVNYQHSLAIPFISDTAIRTPPFTTTLPRESLGFVPDPDDTVNGGSWVCFGVVAT